MVIPKSDNMMDVWAKRLTKMLNWNKREELKPFDKKTNYKVLN